MLQLVRSQRKALLILMPGDWGSFQRGDGIVTLKDRGNFMQGGHNCVL